jgi:hypothetical protein
LINVCLLNICLEIFLHNQIVELVKAVSAVLFKALSCEACAQIIVLTFPEVHLVAEVSTLGHWFIHFDLETIHTECVGVAVNGGTIRLTVELDDALVLGDVVDWVFHFAVLTVFYDWEAQF